MVEKKRNGLITLIIVVVAFMVLTPFKKNINRRKQECPKCKSDKFDINNQPIIGYEDSLNNDFGTPVIQKYITIE